MLKDEVSFDYRTNSRCGDPDRDSPRLYNAHKALWNKTLPNGKELTLEVVGTKSRILLGSNLSDNLSSDRMCPHYHSTYGGKMDDWLDTDEIDDLKQTVRTIGGHIVFPAHRRGGFTINQARGVHRMICDRFDLTLECIRRFYNAEKSPLYKVLCRYTDFFDLFVDFASYVDFFLLDDFIDQNDEVRFSLPFDDFNRSPLPLTIDEYRFYKNHTSECIKSRNQRINGLSAI